MKIPAGLRWKSTGKTLGRGAQGSVQVVTDQTGALQGEFALKALAQGKPPTAYERFAREIAAIKSLDHSGIVKIIDHSQPTDDFQYYVMELEQGAVTLKSLLGDPASPFYREPLKALGVFVQVVEALSKCEEAKVVHRDLSPANVLVLLDHRIKLIDFGLCKISGAETITLPDEGVGTQNYMAPECESGADGQITARSDLYSAGKLLWSAITNQQAFSREDPVFGPKSMKSMFGDLPSAWHLHHIFERTIRHNPGDRFATCAKALTVARRVEFLIVSGFLPLEDLDKCCPLCGWGALIILCESYQGFGHPDPRGFQTARCNYCGYCFAIDTKIPRTELQRRKELQ